MGNPYDPRVFEPNFGMIPPMAPRQPEEMEERPPPWGELPLERDATPQGRMPAEPQRPVPSYGPRVREPQETLQINRRPAVASSAATDAAFYRVYQSEGDWMLQGGQVSAGTGNEVVADIEIGTVGSEPADGKTYWLECTGDGTVTDGRLYSGWNLTAAIAGDGTTIPANTLPTVAEHEARKFHLLLGVWNDEVFAPAASGNLSIAFCPPGNYVIGRF